MVQQLVDTPLGRHAVGDIGVAGDIVRHFSQVVPDRGNQRQYGEKLAILGAVEEFALPDPAFGQAGP